MIRRGWPLLALLTLRASAEGPATGMVEDHAIAGLRTPTDVAWLADGRLAVADPSARTVTVYDGTAAAWTFAADRPLGLGVDGDTLWVADGGALVGLGPDGAPRTRVTLPPNLHATDVAAAEDALWVSSAPDDVVVKVDRQGQELAVVRDVAGPRGLVADGSGGVWIAEAIGGRLVHVDADGKLASVVGSWGLGAGQFVAPKGIARAEDGQLVVADSHQGIVERIGEDGVFGRLVADARGAIPFAHPTGVAVRGDQVAVADTAASRVVVLRPEGPAAKGGAWPAEQWLFRPSSVRDPDPSTACRQCHDGTRTLALGVWDPALHGHPTAVDADVDLPPAVPVRQDGSLGCTSCHALHALEEAEDPQVLRGANLDRPDVGPIRFACGACHVERVSRTDEGLEVGHPLGVPPKGEVALRLEDGRIACITCHAPHGAAFDALLVRSIDDGALCLTCHADHGPETSHHPVGVPANAAAERAIASLGGQLGAGGTLTCVSCHDPHGARERHLLRASGTESACTGCHEQRTRDGHGDEACAACHGMHVAPTPSGAPEPCGACHGDVASAHPMDDAGCTGCHDPHDPTPKACSGCHEEIGQAIASGGHDASQHPVRGARGSCDACHDPHDARAVSHGDLLTLEGPGNPAVARCLVCHDGSTGAVTIERWAHPPGALLVATAVPAGAEGPYTGPDGAPLPAGVLGVITCRTCHDTHAPQKTKDVAVYCRACHGDNTSGLLTDYHERAGRAP